eukprot:TRINITY_DN2428_c1_g1_i1.p1 TRINITY_DN2428_c1_g1~~TRINITY_DN2428_c1_g1_i1.p1  ORF type:complete len:186 (-),score=38.95 TRINITY_DN2428_c1_g1_i1:22-579(-)
MASKDEEDGDDDLFEGMVLINSSQQIDDPSTPNNYHQPLDENLFSDLTLVVNQTLTLEPEPEPEPKPKTTIDAAPSLKQIPSRRKKRGAVRIGYGREEKEPDDSDSSFLQSPLVSENPPPSIDFHRTRDSFPSHLRPSPSEIPIPEAELSSQAALVSDNGAIPLIKEVVEEKEEEEEDDKRGRSK